MITDEQIEAAKRRTKFTEKPHHEHNDCIRIAYEWLDAQPKTKGTTKLYNPLKHMIEAWGGRYVSQTDVEVAAEMHPQIRGKYPTYNITSRTVLPNARRLEGIGEAGKHPGYRDKDYDHFYGDRAEA